MFIVCVAYFSMCRFSVQLAYEHIIKVGQKDISNNILHNYIRGKSWSFIFLSRIRARFKCCLGLNVIFVFFFIIDGKGNNFKVRFFIYLFTNK